MKKLLHFIYWSFFAMAVSRVAKQIRHGLTYRPAIVDCSNPRIYLCIKYEPNKLFIVTDMAVTMDYAGDLISYKNHLNTLFNTYNGFKIFKHDVHAGVKLMNPAYFNIKAYSWGILEECPVETRDSNSTVNKYVRKCLFDKMHKNFVEYVKHPSY
jgi:hypothetical protein